MRKLSTMLAVAALVGAASAYAANPFSDVPTDSWAYQAVSQLAAEGVVVGYPNGTFGGEKNLTRYEMAQIIARALAVEDRANAEQRAVINKLAQEFGAELASLGVKLDTLENKIGNVKLTGDARVRYEKQDAAEVYVLNTKGQLVTAAVNEKAIAKAIDPSLADDKLTYADAAQSLNNALTQTPFKDNEELKDEATQQAGAITSGYVEDEIAPLAQKSDSWTYRLRLNANAKVNDRTEAGARLVLGSSEFGSEAKTEVEFDRLWVKHSLGSVDLTAGRFGAVIGDGLVYDGQFDGASATAFVGPTQVTVGYGYPTELKYFEDFKYNNQGVLERVNYSPKDLDATLTFAQVSTDVVDNVTLKAYYAKLSSKKVQGFVDANENGLRYVVEAHPRNIYGVAAVGYFGNLKLNAEYAKANYKDEDVNDKAAWMAGAAYTHGPATLKVQYFNLGANAPVFTTNTYNQFYTTDWKGFVVGLDYQVAKNVELNLQYNFKGELKEKVALEKTAPAAGYFAQLTYKF